MLNLLKTAEVRAAALAFAILLAGCGGGGNAGTGNQQLPAANSWLQFTPSSVALTAYQGRTLDFTINAKSSKTIAQQFNIAVVETTGLITTDIRLFKVSDYEYKATLKVSDKLDAGTYNGRLEVRMCLDDPVKCTQPVEGSPWYVPLNLTVKSATNLTALADLPQLGAWSTRGGGANHTAYAPVRFDPAKFTQRWSYNIGGLNPAPFPAVVANGIAFVRSNSSNLLALDEATGKLLWQAKMPGGQEATFPTVDGDRVYVGLGQAGYYDDSALLAYDQKSGKPIFKTTLRYPDHIQTEAAPLATGGYIYTHGRSDLGSNHQLRKIDAVSGTIVAQLILPLDSFQTLGADDQYLYSYAESKLSIMRLSDMAVVAKSLVTSNCYSNGQTAIGAAGRLYSRCLVGGTSGLLVSYDAVNKKQVWQVAGTYGETVALAGSTLYAVNGATLEARATDDGKLLWSTPLAGGTAMPVADGRYLLATDNLVFVSGLTTVVAVDTATHQVVWSFPQGGPMSLSSKGVLYLNLGTSMVAINLQ